MSLPTIALVSTGLNVANKVYSGMTGAQSIDAQTNEYRLNAMQQRNAARQAWWEGAMAVNQQTDAANKEIATGVNSMAARGNIGASAQAAVMQGYRNLGKDISAINYRYGNEAIQHMNTANILEYNAAISEANRKNRILSSFLGAGQALAGGLLGAYRLGAFGSGTTYSGAVTPDGMYGAWGGDF